MYYYIYKYLGFFGLPASKLNQNVRQIHSVRNELLTRVGVCVTDAVLPFADFGVPRAFTLGVAPGLRADFSAFLGVGRAGLALCGVGFLRGVRPRLAGDFAFTGGAALTSTSGTSAAGVSFVELFPALRTTNKHEISASRVREPGSLLTYRRSVDPFLEKSILLDSVNTFVQLAAPVCEANHAEKNGTDLTSMNVERLGCGFVQRALLLRRAAGLR